MAECLDIPGCISQGKTPRETLGKLVEAISVCLEVIAEDAAAKAYSEIGPGRYNLSLSASEIQPAA
jgi:predicted RNase H-like HicB family nuclease